MLYILHPVYFINELFIIQESRGLQIRWVVHNTRNRRYSNKMDSRQYKKVKDIQKRDN